MANTARTWTPRIITDEEALRINLGVGYERQLVCRLCESPQLWGLLGVHMKAEWLQDNVSQLIFGAAHQVARSTGLGPSDASVVVRSLKQSNHVGKLSNEDLASCLTCLIEYDREHAPQDHEFANQVAPLIRDLLRGAVIDEMLAARSKNPDGDLSRYTAALNEIESVGRAARVWSPSNVFDESIWGRIESLSRMDKLPTGIPELDTAIEGGIYRQSLIVWGMDTGVGKSHSILHQSLTAMQRGLRVIYIPTEQSVAANLIRSVAWLTNHKTTDVIAKNPATYAAWEEVAKRPHGPIEFAFLPAGSTSSQLRQLIKHILDTTPAFGGGVDVVAVDIADRLRGDAKEYKGTYDCMGDVYEDLANLAIENNGWTITGSQLKDVPGRKGPPRAGDLADSKHKGRIASAVITGWKDQEIEEMRWYHFAKGRDQPTGATVGPLPTALDRGRMYPA